MKRIALAAILLASSVRAADDFTLYDLLPPDTHQFAITYDTTQEREGATLYFNPIRAGSTASKERVISAATGKDLQFEVVSGKDAKSSGLVSPKTADDAQFIRVHLPSPVPKGGETRIRILKTYTDAASYYVKDGLLIFDRPLGVKRNTVLLPKGWELVGSASPAIASTDADGRQRVSFLNDRDDQLPVKITARPGTPSPGSAVGNSFHRAEQDREISYWLLDPASHQFRISHDFTVTRPGQKSVHSFVRKGSVVSPDAKMYDVDSGKALATHNVTGKDVNELGYYPDKSEPDAVVVQGDLEEAVAEGRSTRIRVVETYTDAVGYTMDGTELLWKRTLGRPVNEVTLPAGWILVSVNTPATISLDAEGRVKMRFVNIRNDELSVAIRARRRPAEK
jgi:hypothetical protein